MDLGVDLSLDACLEKVVYEASQIKFCEAQARVRQGQAPLA